MSVDDADSAKSDFCANDDESGMQPCPIYLGLTDAIAMQEAPDA